MVSSTLTILIHALTIGHEEKNDRSRQATEHAVMGLVVHVEIYILEHRVYNATDNTLNDRMGLVRQGIRKIQIH